MSKINSNQENPFDRIMISICDMICPTFYSLGFTPNKITTACVIASYFAVVALYDGHRLNFVIWAVISYFFDCLDGHFARKYNMCTLLGDYYDHITDWIYYGALFYVAFYIKGIKEQFMPYTNLIFLFVFIMFFMMICHLGCQEVIYQQRSSVNVEAPTLSWFKCFAGNNPKERVHYTKWFGCGTFNIFLILVILYFINKLGNSNQGVPP
jgi:phosphatidylglycerophosphate synthase